MATQFTTDEWDQIEELLAKDPDKFGFPKRVYGSVVIGSFNIRKLGKASNRNRRTWEFLADVCRHFDLLAVQEVMDDLSGLRKLMELLGPRFGVIVSDKTGVFPGELGNGERLAFIFNWSIVKRTEIASDVTYDRTKVLTTIAEHNNAVHAALADYGTKLNDFKAKMAAFEADNSLPKPKKPPFKVKLPIFLSFIRQPYCVSFEIQGHPGTQPYQLMAINAHLLFGNRIADRRQEFDALMEWIIERVKQNDKAYYPSFLLLGDLNLKFDNPTKDIKEIVKHIKTFDDNAGHEVIVNFPFIDPHPASGKLLRTNARMTETFDQIGFFVRDDRMPSHVMNAQMGKSPQGPDYGVFNFVELFSKAVNGKAVGSLSKADQSAFIDRFQHKVSDHMPLWVRLPLPQLGQ
jgi:hypothetical protein